ncbi:MULTISPECIES: MerR family transcriptional regulator [Acinetobacter]|uniref:MerR family transcriptional regulator n=1 Tax=Acinetobacter TaxID=469 RepID=UPI001BD13287|nr:MULTISPECIES: MerR family transcriptional regulator [Acinetobacter]MDV8152919.1 MerR family transcriptional regulator [Acinetobacter pittii]QVR66564.1 MerR family transcriptional regulator [Acinetobacter sp. BHS4]
MNISQFSKKYGLSLDTLRFYEKCGVLVPDRLTNGYRNYQNIHEQKVKLTIGLKSVGFTLEEIKQLIELETKPPSEECNIISNQLIDKKIEVISQQIKLLEYGKDILQDVKKYIKDNSFVKNQEIIQDMIENLYKLSKN